MLTGLASTARRLLPILNWIVAYRRDWLTPDLLAGIALWAVMVPESMAYSDIVGVPPIMGLYTIVPALLAYAVFGTSRQLVPQSRPRKSGQDDRWSFCLTAGTLCPSNQEIR